ncbi:hypothetical protein LZ30DRAFT_588222 [Colletotrichum cereale]|nr:hypothetical protein LZ30DRAFT_588222 [Colletotrichum cereale]
MSGNDGKATPADGDEVENPGGNGQGRPTTSDAAKHGASACGSEHANVPDNTSEPASEPAGNHSRPSTAGEAPAQEENASTAGKGATSLPLLAHPELDPKSWFPSAGAESLGSALLDDTASSSRQTGQTGAERGGSQRRGHASAGSSNSELLGGGPRPGDPGASSPEDTAFLLGEEDKGLTNVCDIISHDVPGSGFDANPRPLPPIPHAPGAIPEPQPDITAAPGGTSALQQLPKDSVDKNTTVVTDDRELPPSAMARMSGSVSGSVGASPTTSLTASNPSTPREMGRRERRESSRGHTPDRESGEGASASMYGAGFPAPLRIPGRSQAAGETHGTQGSRGFSSEDPLPGQDEARPSLPIHTPIPTRPVQFDIFAPTAYAPNPLASNPTHPTTPPSRQQSQSSSQETATPTQDRHFDSFRPVPTLLAYEAEPPRHGRGFDHRRAPAPDPGTSARTHLFAAPQFLPDGSAEHARIIRAYNAAFDATSDATKTLLAKRHRYPDYTRDEAARRRKLEFEAATGEGIDDKNYYALFDLETANDGMISALLEWMQGRTWIKVPFVNRIIHQVCRLMFTSAQEEARLRLRFQRDCDLLRDDVDAVDESMALERMRNSWQRMDAAVKNQHLFAKANSAGFRAPEDVERNCDHDAGLWDPLSHKFTTLLRTRQDVEDSIKRQGEPRRDDLGQLDLVYRELGQVNRDTSAYMSIRNEKAKDPKLFHSDDQRVLDFARSLNEGVNSEEDVRQVLTAKFLEVAARRMQSRGMHASKMDQSLDDLPEPSIPVFLSPEMVDCEEMGPEPQDPESVPSDSPPAGGSWAGGSESFHSYYDRPTNSGAPGPSSPSQIPAHPPPDPFPTQASRPEFSHPWQDAQLRRPRGPCTRCQKLEWELKTNQKHIEEGRRVNQAQSNEVERLEGILRAVEDRDMQAALKHMDSYQDMVRAELRQALQFVLSMLEIEVQRAYDHSDVLETSLRFWQTGGSTENVVPELQPMARSVKRLANAIYYVRSQIASQLEKVDSDKEVRLQLLDENDSQRRSLESLRKEMEGMEAQATEVAKAMQQQMQQESDRLKEEIGKCQKQIEDLRNGNGERDTDAPQTADSSIQDLKDELEKKEAELSDLEAQNRALEEQLKTTMEKIEALGKAKDERDEQVKNLEQHVRDLQIKLDAKAETAKWSWGLRPHTDDANSENQHGDRVSQLRAELIKELGRTESKPYQKFSGESRKLLPSLAQSVLWPGKPPAAKQAPDKSSKAFWRLAAFSRRRGEVVAALERRDLEEASAMLDSLQVWNNEMGSWETEAQAAEVRRSINYLRSYANLEIGKIEGFGAASSERLQAARELFSQAASSDGAETRVSWDSLKEHLGYRLTRGDEDPVCECEYKPRVCAKHKRCGGAKYHNFMEEDDGDGAQQADIELTQEAYSSLRDHALVM